jgi:hypothetical protein
VSVSTNSTDSVATQTTNAQGENGRGRYRENQAESSDGTVSEVGTIGSTESSLRERVPAEELESALNWRMEEVRRRMINARVEEEGGENQTERTPAEEGARVEKSAGADEDDDMVDAEGVPAAQAEEVGGEGVEGN